MSFHKLLSALSLKIGWKNLYLIINDPLVLCCLCAYSRRVPAILVKMDLWLVHWLYRIKKRADPPKSWNCAWMEVKSAIIPVDPISFAYLVLPIYIYKVSLFPILKKIYEVIGHMSQTRVFPIHIKSTNQLCCATHLELICIFFLFFFKCILAII